MGQAALAPSAPRIEALNEIDKGVLVESFWHAVNQGAGNLANVPNLVRRVIETGAWHRRVHQGRVYEHAHFIDFITAKPLAGCGWELEKVEALIRDEFETLRLWNDALKVGQGHRSDFDDNINEVKPSKGTSRAYTLDRLSREAPALYRAVCAKEISANAAAIEAGFRKKPSAFEQIQKLIPKLSAKERRAVREMLET